MSETTQRLGIPYPSENEQTWYNTFQVGMEDIDSSIFAALEHENTIVSGGGTISWDGAGTVDWSSDIVFVSPTFARTMTLEAQSVVLTQGNFLILSVPSAPTANVTLLFSQVSTVAPNTTSKVFCYWPTGSTDLIFFTGLLLASGGTSTGLYGGGGGSIAVTDGSTTVNPTTILGIIGATVSNIGGGNAVITIAAPVTPPLITQFVVAQDGTGSHSQIYKAIDDAHDAFVSTSVDQIVFVRGGHYVEDIVFKSGVRVVAESNPNASVNLQVGMLFGRPAGVSIVGVHTFESGSRLRVAVQGICFIAPAGELTLIRVDDTKNYTKNCIQFFDCFFQMDTGTSYAALIVTNDKECANLEMHFERCRMLYTNSSGSWENMIYVGSNGGDQDYTFIDCLFETKGYTGRLVFSANAVGSAEVRFTRCNFEQCYIDNGENQNAILGDIWLTDVTIDYPSRYPVVWLNAGNVYVTRCLLAANGGYEAVLTGGGSVLVDSLSVTPYQFTGQSRTVEAVGYGSYVQPARTIEGCTLSLTGVATVDMDSLLDIGYNYTCVSWYTVGSAGLREVRLHNAARTMGMYFTVWDSGNNANSRNITVTSPATTGGVTGPQTVIAHDNGSLTFVATVDQNNVPHWRAISYLH